MPTVQEVIEQERGTPQKLSNRYDGPVMYRGHEINWKHSIKRVVKTLRRALKRSQFASLNLVGIPGSGKTTCAVNIVTDLIEDEAKESNEIYHLHWMGPDELRDLGNVLESLQKGQNHICIFDDVSKALDRLSGAEQSEIFEMLTTTRHITGGKLLICSLYHYTFANLKSVKSQGVVVVYTSVTTTEYTNISAQLTTPKNKRILKKFARIYESSFMYEKFHLLTHDGAKKAKEFIDGEPFRPCLVVNLFKVHIALFMELENAYRPPKKIKKRISGKALVDNVNASYPELGNYVLGIMAFQKGEIGAVRNQFASCYKFIQENLLREYKVDWKEVTAHVKKKREKRLYRNRKDEKELAEKIITESKESEENLES